MDHDPRPVEAETVAVAIAAISAIASAISAYTNRQSVDRAHRPFVWPAISHKGDPDGSHVLLVRLHNDGAGTAYDVRWSIATLMLDQNDNAVEDRLFEDEHVSQVIRAVRAGEILPPQDQGWLEKAVALPPDDVWWLLVRWTDAAGVRWEISEQGPSLLRAEPRRLRTWPWQVWRPKRSW
jgi:hypothetical protein